MTLPPKMLTILPIDDRYLGITALLTVLMQLFFFFIAYGCQFDKVGKLGAV